MRVIEISVLPDIRRIRLKIEMPDPDRYMTGQVPHIPKRIFRLLPRLYRHTCDNGEGLTFRQECQNTEIPHLFEHLIIELQLQAQQNESDLLSGETHWNWQVDPRGHYHVYVDYENEFLAVGAIRLAERILRSVDDRDMEAVDMNAEMIRLRELMILGRQVIGDVTPVPTDRHNPPPARTWASISFGSGGGSLAQAEAA